MAVAFVAGALAVVGFAGLVAADFGVSRAALFAAKLELSNQPMVTWQAYKLRAGESLPQVALKFGLPLETLRTVNGIGPRATVPGGHAVLVPSQAPSDASIASLQNAVFTTVASGRTLYHRVRKGETIASIAGRYDVTSQELRTWNAGLGARIVPGQKLRVISDVTHARGKAKTGKHKGVAPAAQAVRTVMPAVKPKPARIAQHP